MNIGHEHEELVESFEFRGVKVDLIRWKPSIWCGKVGYANTNNGEPNVGRILAAYSEVTKPKNDAVGAEEFWDAQMSLNYLSSERPNGVLMAMLVNTKEQPEHFDVMEFPEAFYMRVLLSEENADALCQMPWYGGLPPYEWVSDYIAPSKGYVLGDDTLPIVEYIRHNKVTFAPEAHYMYVPVKKKEEKK